MGVASVMLLSFVSPVRAAAQACQVAKGDAAAPAVGSWALRWFPDGPPDKKLATAEVIARTACVLAAPGVHLWAIQGIRKEQLPRFDKVLTELKKLSGGPWRARFDGCPGRKRRHVGLIYREDKVQLTHLQDLRYINPTLEPCRKGLGPKPLRPAVGGFATFSDSLAFNFVSFHLDGGTKLRNHAHRIASVRGFAPALSRLKRFSGSSTILFAGVHNARGCRDEVRGCIRPIPPQEERASFQRVVAELEQPMESLGPTEVTACLPRPLPLDGFFASKKFADELKDQPIRLIKDEATACKSSSEPWTYVSDHQPLILKLPDSPRP